MAINEKFVVSPEFESLFSLSEKDNNEVDALVLAAQFLSQITELLIERNISRKELAQNIGVSASWLTQIFRGDKLPNWETIVKITNYLDINFEIKIKNQPSSTKYTEEEKENRAAFQFPKRHSFTSFHKSLRPVRDEESDELLSVPKKDYPMIA